ncbi:MAG: glycosyltransferase family 2 protein [Bacteroidales bacterium]|nr:glycosyltransferase family 2 protein [Bacteroidales bacterium]
MEKSIEQLMTPCDNFARYSGTPSLPVCGTPVPHKVTIAIPTYKRTATLRATVESALAQKGFDDYDILICDNNPERGDETEEYVRSLASPRIVYYKHAANLGMTGNWNRIVELCKSEYLVLVHDDDLLHPEFLSRCMRIVSDKPGIDCLYPKKNRFSDDSPDYPELTPGPVYRLRMRDYLPGNPDAPTGVLFRRDAIMSLGGWKEEAYPSADYYFNVLAAERLGVYRCEAPLCMYRWSINESQKPETLLAFMRTCQPLKEWIGTRLHLPFRWKKAFVRNFNAFLKDKIQETGASGMDFSGLELPRNDREAAEDRRITRTLGRLISATHFFDRRLCRRY